MKKILITNDDGIHAVGIQTLALRLRDEGYDLLVVAPDRERSASGHSMTMDRPLRVKKIEKSRLSGDFPAYSCDGTPTDCVIMGIDAMGFKPDLVLSGINCGPNLGDDITYSGTACAAMEGLIFGYRSMALSLVCFPGDEKKEFDSAAETALEIIKGLAKHPMAEDIFYNVNIPNLPLGDIRGLKLTRKGTRRYRDKITVVKTPFGGEAYWVGGRIYDELHENTDVRAIADGYVSLTPVHLELTCFSALDAAKSGTMEAELSAALKEKVNRKH
ncbi:MAG: 5'/3'-nucleotidase SurE [Synergistaceae bacterium]|nr:5'/3'-nucleotidase SurE [Synergistaceae bacterium]